MRSACVVLVQDELGMCANEEGIDEILEMKCCTMGVSMWQP